MTPEQAEAELAVINTELARRDAWLIALPNGVPLVQRPLWAIEPVITTQPSQRDVWLASLPGVVPLTEFQRGQYEALCLLYPEPKEIIS